VGTAEPETEEAVETGVSDGSGCQDSLIPCQSGPPLSPCLVRPGGLARSIGTRDVSEDKMQSKWVRQSRAMTCHQPGVRTACTRLQSPSREQKRGLYVSELMLFAEETRGEMRISQASYRSGCLAADDRQW
jgi:hypothetical protein